ncbi:lysylphosphatidylglycerol synthase transmembrane domain-containing protein [Methanolobus psychrotolerans]|uniref:lysylphosphatidylglycerol synthase transmembrane domain-containing protein n=1 Tax=Methanolobus psychrotolerans TaxID=1874706 RepID=UPI000B91C750|nr:flippase-like domain-containing protein [Methanolobus psychrotolerans]
MNKVKKWIFVSLLISLVSSVIVFLFTFDSGTIDALMEIKPEYILAAACIHAITYVIWGLRTRSLCKALGYDLGYLKSFEIVTSGTLAASITPSSLGGEPLRIHLLHGQNIPLGKATAVVIGERLLDGILILTMAPFSVYALRSIQKDSVFDAIFIFAEAGLIFILFLTLYAIWKPEPTKKVVYFFVQRLAQLLGRKTDDALEKIMTRVDSELEYFHDSISVLLNEGRRGLVFGIFHTVIFWFVDFFMLYVILVGLNQHPDPILVFASQVIIIVLLVIPATPGASGIAEFAGTTVFSLFISSSVLGIAVIAWRAFTFYMNLFVGGFVSFKILKDTEFIKKFLN